MRQRHPNRHKLLWVSRPTNSKTGKIPTAYVGDSKAESWQSCAGCELRDNSKCYAWYGNPARGFASILKAYAHSPERYSLEHALSKRHKRAKVARFGALGDPARAKREELLRALQEVRGAGLGVIGYTHHWRGEPATGALRREFMASCNNTDEADEAIDSGWAPASVVPADLQGKITVTPKGRRLVVCPAQQAEKRGGPAFTCNDCRLCDPKRLARSKFDGIAFIDHSPAVLARARAKGRKLKTI